MTSSLGTIARTKIERGSQRNARDVRRSVGDEFRQAREDAGISLSALAAIAHVPKSFLHGIEAGTERPTVEVLSRIASALGGKVALRFEPSSGPRIRDHLQAAMIGAVVQVLNARWRRFVEVGVQRPVRGWIDLVIHDPEESVIVASEAHSQLRRLEQQVRWAKAKADALATGGSSELIPALAGIPDTNVSRLLLLRSTRTNRELVSLHADFLATAYPAAHEAAVEALRGVASWPGPAIVWMNVADGTAAVAGRGPRWAACSAVL